MSDRESDPQALLALGNGRAVCYLSGPDLATFFGPTYSSPAIATAVWGGSAEWREEGVTDGVARFDTAGAGGARVDVFVEAHTAALTYAWTGRLESVLEVVPASVVADVWHKLNLGSGVLGMIVEIARGGLLYKYPSSLPYYAVVLASGCRIETASEHQVRLVPHSRNGWISVLAGNDFAVVRREAIRLAGGDPTERRSAAAEFARASIADLTVAAGGSGLALDGESFASTAMEIVAQQSEGGGIIAGHNYALAYVRDQFGTCEGLLAMGLYENVRRNILFRFGKWQRFGTLANAETMSDEAIRHRHENDDVEQTAYTVLQVLRYAEVSRDTAIIDEVAPMIDWCMRVQSASLVGGALPFNGDETYIAGGILPRWAIGDGSFEATTLFHAAIEALAEHRSRASIGGLNWDRLEADAGRIEADFAANFVRDGAVVTNSLRRRTLAVPPPSRNGVCENCHNFPTVVVRRASGRYTCWRCDGVELPAPPEGERIVASSALLPTMVPTTLLTPAVQEADVLATLRRWSEHGYLPPEGPAGLSVGYDEGLLLRGLTKLGHPDAGRVAVALAGRRDRFGMWSEFYSEGIAVGTRCRPWESAMNVAALRGFLSAHGRPGFTGL